jgi:hypothetical protein
MKLPYLAEPAKYCGLYVFDFGQWCAVGYTAEEIAVLLASEQYAGGQAYKIRRAQADGRMELQGVSGALLRAESGMFFFRAQLAEARVDFDALVAAAEAHKPPRAATIHLVERRSAESKARFATALIFAAEGVDDIAAWLNEIGYAGGDVVEGGASHLANYRAEDKRVIEGRQLSSAAGHTSRSAADVLASVRQAVQR